MSKKIVAMLMAVAMAFSLLPVTAFATGEESNKTYDDKDTATQETGVTASKTASANGDGTYTITLKVDGTTKTETGKQNLPADIVLVVDTSTSMLAKVGQTTRLAIAKTAAANFASGLMDASDAIRIGLYDFSGSNRTNVPLTSYKSTITQAIQNLRTPEWYNQDGTNYTLGLNGAKDILQASEEGRQKFIVFISDGEPKNGKNGIDVSKELIEQGVTILTVGVDVDSSGAKALKKISSKDKKDNPYYYSASTSGDSGKALDAILAQIQKEIETQIHSGTNAVLTDVINLDEFDLESYDESKLRLAEDGKTLTWNIGTIGSETQTATIVVKPKANKYGVLHTNKDVSLTFDSTKQSKKVTFTKDAIGDPTITIKQPEQSYTINYVWGDGSTQRKVLETKTDNGTIGENFTADRTKTFDGYTMIPGQTLEKEIGANSADNVLTIHYQKNLTVTGDSEERAYTGAQQELTTFTVDGLAEGDSYSDLSYSAVGTTVGEYPGEFSGILKIQNQGENVTGSYAITQNPGTLTITKDTNQTTVQITGKHDTVTYDGKEHLVSGYTTDIGNRDITVALNAGKVAEAKGTNVGEYKMGLTAADFTATSSSYDNIKITVEDGYLEIQPKSISPDQETGIVVTNPLNSKYDGQEHKNSIEVTDTKTGKTLTKDTDYTLQYSDDVINAGKVTITVKGIGNYTGEFSRDYHITPRNVTLTSATDRKEYNGTPLTNDTVTASNDGFAQDEGATYHVTGSQTRPGKSDNTFTYTLNKGTLAKNYNITTATGELEVTGSDTITVNLSKLIQKELKLEEESSLPQDATFKVTVTENNKDNPATITGETANTNESTSWTVNGMTYTAPFNFTGNLTLEKGKTYSYQVTEDKSDPVSGVEYDSTTYQLTITANMNESYSASYTVTPTSDAAEAAPTDVTPAAPLTIQNTYQAPDLTVEKKTVSVAGEPVNNNNPVAHVGEQIIWSVTVTNKNSTPAHVTLTDAMAEGVYTDDKCETQANWNTDTHSWTATVSETDPVTYYVTYTVKADDISKGKIVNTIVMKNGDEEKNANSDPVSTWDTKQLKSATGRLESSDWTTTVKLTLPKVNENKEGTPVITGDAGQEPEVRPIIAISKGSYVIDEIGDGFTLVGIGDSALENGSFTLTVGGKEITGEVAGDTVNFGQLEGDSYPYTVTYTPTTKTFVWNINKDVCADTEVTLSYKLKLDNPNKTAGTHGVTDLNGDGKVDDTGVAVDTTKALYTNKSAELYKDDKTKLADFPKPSVSYTISSGNSGSHSGGSRPSLNTKDHYGYIIGYPVDYYTGQPTTDQTKKPVRPEGKITRAEVATIYFRMLTDESRTKFWSQSSGYSDVKTGDWFNNAVSTLSNAGIIAGYEDGSFRPNGYITRAEFATIAARFFDVTYNGKDLFPDISGHWAKDYINQAANKGFVNGYEDGTFKPDRNITRAEAVTLVNRTLDRHPDKNHFTKDMLVWPDNMDQTKWYYADMQEATNSHTYQMKENSDKTKYENWTKTLPIRNWEALEKAWSNANSSQGNGNVV